MTTPTQRCLKFLKNQGYTVACVEKWNAHAKVRQDLWGCVDILAIRPGEILGVQVTSDSNVSARVAKALAEPRLLEWLLAGGRFCVIGFGKKGPRGKPKKWVARRIEIVEEDFQ